MPTSARSRVLLGVALVAIVSAGIIGVSETRSRLAEAEAERLAAARFEFSQDVRAVRVELGAPALEARRAAAALRLLLAEAITGTDRPIDALEADLHRRSTELWELADRLRTASARETPDPPDALTSEDSGPAAARLDGLHEQAARTADHLERAAEAAEQLGPAVLELTGAATVFAATAEELPDTPDPEALADTWRTVADHLEPYRSAAERVAAEAGEGGTGADPSLAALARAHLGMIEQLEQAAEQAADDLDAGRVDAYNERRDDTFAAAEVLHAELVAALETAVAAAVAPVEAAEERALGLLSELEALRRATPAQLATA